MSPRAAPWYRDGFILVTVARNNDAYNHPRVSVCKRYQGYGLPPEEEHTNPTGNAQTLISFEFQQNIGRVAEGRGPIERGEPWLQVGRVAYGGEGDVVGPAYGGHLDTRVRVEQYGVSDELFPRLRSVDKALKKHRATLDKLGVTGSECDCTTLVQALRTQWKLPVLFVVYLGGGFGNSRQIAKVEPDPAFPTAQAIEIEDTRHKKGA